MLVEVKVPILSESVSEATLSNWLKKAGDYVDQDENLVDLETDKVVLEIPAPSKGLLKEIKYSNGSNVKSDEVIAIIDTEAKAAQAANEPDMSRPQTEAPVSSSEAKVTSITSKQAEASQALSPAVRKLISEYEIDPKAIIGTGKDGRLTKGDVIKHIKSLTHREQQPGAAAQPQTIPQAEEQVIAEATPATTVPPTGEQFKRPVNEPLLKPVIPEARPEQRVPMSRLRQRVAERLKDAQNTAAILTTFNEVNMKPIMDIRAKYKDLFVQRYGTKLGFMPFFVRAAVDALKQHPVMNASVDENDIIYHGYYDIGIAVGSPRGLVVPILRDADQMSFAEIEIAIKTYGQKAKDGKLSLDDLTGGTFSISNGGVYGSMLSTPILNPPQSAILGMHNIVERPVVENGEIVVRPMMYLAVSYDHRIIDGHDAVLFLVAIKQVLEDPARMLLDI